MAALRYELNPYVRPSSLKVPDKVACAEDRYIKRLRETIRSAEELGRSEMAKLLRMEVAAVAAEQ